MKLQTDVMTAPPSKIYVVGEQPYDTIPEENMKQGLIWIFGPEGGGGSVLRIFRNKPKFGGFFWNKADLSQNWPAIPEQEIVLLRTKIISFPFVEQARSQIFSGPPSAAIFSNSYYHLTNPN